MAMKENVEIVRQKVVVEAEMVCIKEIVDTFLKTFSKTFPKI